jgi:putative ATP-dependent endonuclease of OLD family
VERQLDGTISRQLPVAIFANQVLLVEGTTEEAVLHGIADRSSAAYLETRGVSVVAAGGKGNLLLVHGILTSLGIPTYCMFDGDAGGESRGVAAGKKAELVDGEKKSNIKLNRSILEYFKQPPVDFPIESETEFVTVLSDHLEELLTREWPEWEAACEDLATETGTSFSKNEGAYRAATKNAAGQASPLLSRVISRAEQISAVYTNDPMSGK